MRARVLSYPAKDECAQLHRSCPPSTPQGDNQFCRLVHLPYATVDPHHHCPHIGKSGGGACVNQVRGAVRGMRCGAPGASTSTRGRAFASRCGSALRQVTGLQGCGH